MCVTITGFQHFIQHIEDLKSIGTTPNLVIMQHKKRLFGYLSSKTLTIESARKVKGISDARANMKAMTLIREVPFRFRYVPQENHNPDIRVNS